jgi:hypothetical protein
MEFCLTQQKPLKFNKTPVLEASITAIAATPKSSEIQSP